MHKKPKLKAVIKTTVKKYAPGTSQDDINSGIAVPIEVIETEKEERLNGTS